jgi:hypothetical protein
MVGNIVVAVMTMMIFHDRLQQLQTKEVICVPTPLGYGNLPDGGSYIIMKHLQFRPFGMVSDSSVSSPLYLISSSSSKTCFCCFFSGAYVSSPDSYHDLIIHYCGIFVVEDHVVTL